MLLEVLILVEELLDLRLIRLAFLFKRHLVTFALTGDLLIAVQERII
jgi:hypothetical protein